MRRAQVQHIMIFVIGLVVISLVLLFGYTTLENLNDDRCEIQRLQFGTNLQQAIERNTEWGTSAVITLKAPCETEQVCFFDKELVDTPPTDKSYIPPQWDPSGSWATIVDSTLQTNAQGGQGDQTNIFTINAQQNIEPVERYSSARAAIQVNDGTSTCADVEGEQIKIRMEGTGRAVKIIDVE